MTRLSGLLILTIITFTKLLAIDTATFPEGELSDLNVLLSDESALNSNFVSTEHTAAAYLSESNNSLNTVTTDYSFNYKPTPQYENVAFRLFNREKDGGISNKDWNGLKSKGMAQAVIGLRKHEIEKRNERAQQSQLRIEQGGKAEYNPNLFHWSTWKCAADRMPWGKHKPENGQNSPNCLEAIRVGW
tara:strand:- start:443 stop:1006 length:564 start_codon:yes stop_codon:yes gene_type:complete